MSGASALSEIPGRLEKVFLNDVNELSPRGIYAVNMYTLGVPHTVIVDDYFPLRVVNGRLGTVYAGIGSDGSIWGPILEKAFAKFHGNYSHLNYGKPHLAVRTLYGAPALHHIHKNIGADELWDILQNADENDDVITCSTAGADHHTQNHVGLANGHAYTVLSVHEV